MNFISRYSLSFPPLEIFLNAPKLRQNFFRLSPSICNFFTSNRDESNKILAYVIDCALDARKKRSIITFAFSAIYPTTSVNFYFLLSHNLIAVNSDNFCVICA